MIGYSSFISHAYQPNRLICIITKNNNSCVSFDDVQGFVCYIISWFYGALFFIVYLLLVLNKIQFTFEVVPCLILSLFR